MLHILSLILMLLCQVHNLTAAAEEEEGGSYENAKRGDDLEGDKLCYIYNRKQLADEQIYCFKSASNRDAVTCMLQCNLAH